MLKLEDLNSEFMKFGAVNMEIKKGSIVGILGESGLGKSVLLKTIADLIPHTGKVFLGDEEQNSIKASEWRKKVSLLPANFIFWENTTKDHFRDINEDLFIKLGLDPEYILDKKTEDLSSGEKQRIGLIKVISNNPKVLLLDEPCANLDNKNKERVEKLILEYASKQKAIVIWVGHDDEQLKRICDMLIISKKNRFRKVSL